MAAKHLSNDEFFEKLSKLFDSRLTADHGSIYLTQKRLTHGLDAASPQTSSDADDTLADLNPTHTFPVLIRATNGKGKGLDGKYHRKEKVKLSTVVQPDAIEGFYARYADICKAGMQALQKRDRSKRKKAKKAKKKGANEAETKA